MIYTILGNIMEKSLSDFREWLEQIEADLNERSSDAAMQNRERVAAALNLLDAFEGK